MVELSFVTLIRPESELFEDVLETGDESPAELFVVGCTLVDASLLADGFNGLAVGFLPDECSAKEQCIVENVVCVYHERLLADCRTCREGCSMESWTIELKKL